MRKNQLRARQTDGWRPRLSSPLLLSPVCFSPLFHPPRSSPSPLFFMEPLNKDVTARKERGREGNGGEREETVEGRYAGGRMCKQGEHDDMQAVARTEILGLERRLRKAIRIGRNTNHNKREYVVTSKIIIIQAYV